MGWTTLKGADDPVEEIEPDNPWECADPNAVPIGTLDRPAFATDVPPPVVLCFKIYSVPEPDESWPQKDTGEALSIVTLPGPNPL